MNADGIWATGEVAIDLELTCVRCLEPFTYPLRSQMTSPWKWSGPTTETVDLTPLLSETIFSSPCLPTRTAIGRASEFVRRKHSRRKKLSRLEKATAGAGQNRPPHGPRSTNSKTRPTGPESQFCRTAVKGTTVLWESPNAKPPRCACAPGAPPTAGTPRKLEPLPPVQQPLCSRTSLVPCLRLLQRPAGVDHRGLKFAARVNRDPS